jgi:hypothetical protein
MVARRAHRDKSVLDIAAHDFVNRHGHATHAMRDRGKTIRAHKSVGIKMHFSARRIRGLYRIGIVRRMNPQDGRAIDTRGIRPPQFGEMGVIQSISDGADAAGTFWMPGSGIVIEESGMT